VPITENNGPEVFGPSGLVYSSKQSSAQINCSIEISQSETINK